MKKLPQVKYEKITPEVHAEKCPVCSGFGSLKHGSLVCHGCEGKGYILVPNFTEEEDARS